LTNNFATGNEQLKRLDIMGDSHKKMDLNSFIFLCFYSSSMPMLLRLIGQPFFHSIKSVAIPYNQIVHGQLMQRISPHRLLQEP
jgi:hypothetical protein